MNMKQRIGLILALTGAILLLQPDLDVRLRRRLLSVDAQQGVDRPGGQGVDVGR